MERNEDLLATNASRVGRRGRTPPGRIAELVRDNHERVELGDIHCRYVKAALGIASRLPSQSRLRFQASLICPHPGARERVGVLIDDPAGEADARPGGFPI